MRSLDAKRMALNIRGLKIADSDEMRVSLKILSSAAMALSDPVGGGTGVPLLSRVLSDKLSHGFVAD